MADLERDYYEEQSFQRADAELGDLTSFNAEYGYLEAIVRGFRSGFLKEHEYRQLTQCDLLDDLKVSMGDTDYGATVAGLGKLTPEILVDKCWEKLVDEFDHIRSQATGQLNTFLNFITYEYMIDNVSFLITSLIKGGDPNLLLAKCDPLGKFPRMRSVSTFENNEDGLFELYSTVLVDTPIAPYFEEFFTMDGKGDSNSGFDEMQRVFSDEEIEIISNMLKKYWLEDFYRYCKTLGGTTFELMSELLSFEADRRAISITMNSFGTELNEAVERETKRRSLYCNFGSLYPEGVLALTSVNDETRLKTAILDKYEPFRTIYAESQRDGKSFEDCLQAYEVELCKKAFEQQSHFACFYAYVKLKAQEKRNIYWISECIHQKQKDASKMNRWIKTF